MVWRRAAINRISPPTLMCFASCSIFFSIRFMWWRMWSIVVACCLHVSASENSTSRTTDPSMLVDTAPSSLPRKCSSSLTACAAADTRTLPVAVPGRLLSKSSVPVEAAVPGRESDSRAYASSRATMSFS